MSHRFLLPLLVGSLLSAAGGSAEPVSISADERDMAETITADQLSSYLHFVASDAMGGRDTPSAGLDVTAEFLKMNLARWGFQPAGDSGTYFQNIVISQESTDPDQTFLEIDGQSFEMTKDFLKPTALSGIGSITGAGLVFGGNGWLVKSKGYDALAGVDVRGKVVVLYSKENPRRNLTPLPSGMTAADLVGAPGEDWADPFTHAKNKGAVGLLVIVSERTWNGLGRSLARATSFPERLRAEAEGLSPTLPGLVVSSKVGDAILTGESGDRTSATAFAIQKTVDLGVAFTRELSKTQNVVALWEGRDPALRHEMVAVGAHYDHLGTNPDLPGEDKIFNGADDDGSGTVAELAIAEALAKAPTRPKRSVLLVWHAGEEKGMWGSQYFTKFPTVDLGNVVAQLNIDMIGRSRAPGEKTINCEAPDRPCNERLSGANEIYIVGSEMMSSTLAAVVNGTNDQYLKLEYNRHFDDPDDPERIFFRSDHFQYARHHIPITFWFDGVHEDYHQPTDEADKIDYRKMERVTRTIFLTMWELTELPDRPKVDQELPPELQR